MPMNSGILKSLTHILNDAFDWEKSGLYYKIQVTPAVKIGFRKPYEKYLGTRVRIEKKLDRKGCWRPEIYTVFARNGNPIFIAHRQWFSEMTDEPVLPNYQFNAENNENNSTPMVAATASMAPSGSSLENLSWEELFDI